MLKLVLGLVLLTLVTGSKCPNEDLCGEQQTCCQIRSGEYTCCPFHQGECCEDHLHCCPEGMLCQTTESTCSNTTHSLPWAERLPTQHARLLKSFRMISTSTGSKDTTICPDDSSCPPEFTCLQQSDGYGCCPVAQGIMCLDGKHCCPDDHQCTADSTSCTKKKEPVQAVMCADGISECPTGTTCCEATGPGWSCCPVLRAVCCADKVHCCPEDSVCDVNGSKCVSSTQQELPMWAKFPARVRADWEGSESAKMTNTPERTTESHTPLHIALSQGSDVPCNSSVSCPDGTTCCKNAEGTWGCCPFSQAVCCEDLIHCCPHGKKCNLAAMTCDDSSGSVPWLKKEPARPIRGQKVPETKGSDVPCNSSVSCPDGTTCCKNAEGTWGCCPFSQAVCCEDLIHCCPHGKKCNLAAMTCDDSSGSVPWLKKEPARPIRGQKVPETKGSDVPCNSSVSCPDGTTCCKNAEGTWGCCPFSQAVCCEDLIHCCPHGKKCNLAAMTCDDSSGSVPWLKKEPARPIRGQKVPETKGSDVPCNSSVSCPDGTTCCKNAEGTWGCCPFSQAVCCEDLIHCCPHGKKCNLAAMTCDDSSGSVPWLKKEPARPIRGQKVPETKGSDVPCNSSVSCPDGTTCCKNAEGTWGCCPFSQAVCCEDLIHCCPHGKKCNLAAMTCDDSSGSVPWLKKEPARPIRGQKVPETKGSDVPCNSSVSCPDGTTCCKNAEGTWGCCPFSQAVCCEDLIHCCPHEKKCNLAAMTCDDSSGSVPWLKKEPARPIRGQKVPETKGSDVPCNSSVSCPDGTTCCKNAEGTWGCCPFSQAVCCEDLIHCCPHGKKCNLAAMTCDDSSGSVPWLKKEPARPIRGQKVPETKGSDVPCNSSVSCPDGTTCCKNAEGTWGCCPFSQAVCCEDLIHCCPHGKKCNLAAMTCDDSSGSVPWLKKEPARPIRGQKVPETKGSDVPCNSSVSCPDGTTCCKNAEGTWGCCPFSQAVCCEDLIHCCPHGKKCNLAAMTCDDSSGSVPWLKKEPARPIRGQKVPETKGSDVPCNSSVSCPDGTTCCKNAEGTWGCCPFSQAVCCEDLIHCCPHGKKCNLAAMTCDDSSGSVPWLKKEPARPIRGQKVPETKGSDVPCNSSVSCPDGTTCCKNAEGTWGCCPFSQAVCCEDLIHCCPHGKKCNLAAMTCDDSSGSVPWLKKEPARPIRGQKVPETKGSDVPCNSSVSCPDGTTCCKNAEGTWGCCPFSQAVCCEDLIHCCPHGKKCNLAAMTCDDSSGSVPWLKKEPARPIRGQKVPETKGSDVPCNSSVSCPDGTTCCKNAEGTWGCCPFSQAVCCEDLIHCCPHGKKCNLAAQSCDDPSGSVPWLKKEPARPSEDQKPLAKGHKSSGGVLCDSSHSCPDSTSCCKDYNGHWQCCPFPQGVCCKDHFHCCPHDSTCNFSTLTCNHGNSSVPMAVLEDTYSHPSQEGQEEAEMERSGNVMNVQCDEQTSCPDGTTCCFMHNFQKWGCCPLPKAVCCEDGEHCCPEHYKCDESQTSCIKGDVVMPWYAKLASHSSPVSVLGSGGLWCDAQTRCSEGQSCCRLSTGEWACCPLPEAVCCSDGEHCCPTGYSCDVDSGSCVKTIGLPMETLSHIQSLHNDIKCDSEFSCKDSETCCKISQTAWGCCPLPKAVCCSDMQHCCPEGFTCDDSGMCYPATDFSWDNWQVFFSKKERPGVL
ncbi:granulin a [Brachyhypopomus gauderio]|uniref:granulin a n=1 Tax=Brachyhypopomus gauderio TaxID=698409 RepID=UPI0040424B94